MNPVLLYIVKAAFCVTAFYLFYLFFLGRDTMYERNRIFILLSFLSALILPLVTIQTKQPLDIQFFGKDLTGVTINDTTGAIPDMAESLPLLNWKQVIFMIYLSGVFLLGLKLLAEIMSLLLLIQKQKRNGSHIVSLKNHKSSGFSAFGHIFIDSGLIPEEAQEIIKHEQKHLNQYHFFDLLFVEVLKVLQWFNPFIYLFDRSLRAVHEFQADEECLNSGITVQSYQGLMLNQVFRVKVFSAANSFSNPTLIKKRMIMMTKKRSRALANLKIILVMPVLVLLLISFSTCAVKKKSAETLTVTPAYTVINETKLTRSREPEPFVVVEEMPMFPGGDSALLKYIYENTKYPESAKANNISGRVVVRFCVTETGKVDRISVLKGVSPELDVEAIRVISTLPAFKPGKQGGIAVPVWYMAPIQFGPVTKTAVLPQVPPPPPPPPATDTKGKTEPFEIVEEMPQFPGGDSALLAYIYQNTKYPETAKANKIMGRVVIRFCVTETGVVDQISILKGVDPALDAEAFRVASTLPAFKPGKQGGVPVPVWCMIPITFSLK
ncbi:MAG: M56 family metallopeptidase [Bacteroidales bacterium]|nr:M56 family metallopeptidase [Bacteroidales bacterium]